MRRSIPLVICFAAAGLSGCIASTALDVVTAPVRAAGKAVDLATTSQSEADERRGRALRQRDERLGELQRDYRRHARQCEDGDERACMRAEETSAAIDAALDQTY